MRIKSQRSQDRTSSNSQHFPSTILRQKYGKLGHFTSENIIQKVLTTKEELKNYFVATYFDLVIITSIFEVKITLCQSMYLNETKKG